ncbi:unnamed protein product [Boreogadus saida]
MPRSTVHRIVHRVTEEVVAIRHKVIHLPKNPEDLAAVTHGFAGLARHRTFGKAAGAIDGCHMAKIGEVLKRDLKRQRTAQLESDSDDTCCDLFDEPKKPRRAFIDSNTIREEDRHEKVLDAYPCFKDVGHVMEELQRIMDKDNTNFIDELKGRWHDFCQKLQFFGVWKKALKPPMGMDKAEQALEILRVLPSLFPSTSAPPKRVRNASEALVHVLKETEDPNSYLKNGLSPAQS